MSMVIPPRARLALCLSNALLPPPESASARSMCDLANELEALSQTLDLALDDTLIRLRLSGSRFDQESTLVHYSRLFLSPPVPARLNLGWYLDGSLNGPVQDELATWYAQHELGKSDSFRDFPDHLAALLEFLAWLEVRGESDEATAFAARFLHPALHWLESDVAHADAGSPYLELIRILHQALKVMYSAAETKVTHQPFSKRHSRPGQVSCERCGKDFTTERDLAVMRKALQTQGLPVDHLAHCPDCRSLQDSAR